MAESAFNLGMLAGDPKFWPFAGSEYELQRLAYGAGTNNFLVSLEELSIHSDPFTICFVPRKSRIYYSSLRYPRTIFSQYVPDALRHKPKNVQKILELAKTKYQLNELDSLPIAGYKILQLASSLSQLFAILKKDNDFYICKIPIMEDIGFNTHAGRLPVIKRLTSNHPLHDNLELSVVDNELAMTVYLLDKTAKKIYHSIFLEHSLNEVILQELLLPKIFSVVAFSSFCITTDGFVDRLFLLDTDKATVSAFKKSHLLKKASFDFVDSYEIPSPGVFKIEYFSIKTKHVDGMELHPRSQLREIDLLLLFSEDRVWSINLVTKDAYLQIGGGHHTPSTIDNDLTSYRITNNKFAYVVSENFILFGDPYARDTKESLSMLTRPEVYGKCYALLTSKTRDLMYMKQGQNIKIDPRDYEMS